MENIMPYLTSKMKYQNFLKQNNSWNRFRYENTSNTRQRTKNSQFRHYLRGKHDQKIPKKTIPKKTQQ